MVQEFVPDARNRIDLIKLYNKDAPTTYDLYLDYTFDGEGNVLAIGNDSFTYDSQDRLVTTRLMGARRHITLIRWGIGRRL